MRETEEVLRERVRQLEEDNRMLKRKIIMLHGELTSSQDAYMQLQWVVRNLPA